MSLSEFLTLSFRNVKKRKVRSILTVFGITIAIATIFLLVSISLGLNSAVQEQFRQLGTDKFFISPKGQLGDATTSSVVKLTDKDIDAIKSVSGVKAVSYWSVASAKIQIGKEIRFANVIGLPLDAYDVFKESGFVKADSGRLLSQGDSGKIMIGYLYKYGNVFKKPLDAGDTLKINNNTFRVKAILAQVGNGPDDKNIFMPLDDFEIMFPDQKNSYNQIAVQVTSGQNLTLIAQRVEKQLLNERNLDKKTEDFFMQTPEELLATFGTVLNIMTGFLLGVAAISLIVGGIGITNTMYTAVLERTKEIGVMKAVGAKNSDIVKIFTIESGLLGLVGGTIGILLAMIIGKGIEYIAVNFLNTTLLQVSTPWYLILGSLAFSFIVGAAAGIVPAMRASRIRPVQALRYE